MIDWLLIPRNGALLNWIGFIFGGLGIAFALIGLWLTYKQLRAIKSEAEATMAAIQSVQLKVASFDTVQECQVARAHINSIRNYIRKEEWSSIIREYENLIQSFLRLSHSNSLISQEDRAALSNMTINMAKICDGIRKKQAGGKPVVMYGQDQALRDFSDIMTKVTFSVVREIQQ